MDGCLVKGLASDDSTICSSIEVPESRDKEESRIIQLSYVVLKSKRESSKAPILFLQGGPGASGIALYYFFKTTSLYEDRDVILFDQRGTGSSSAECPDLGDRFIQLLGKDITSIHDEMEQLIEETADCRKSLQDKGYDFGAYNSLQNAKDIEELKEHLGYEKLVLFGGSYGSRLALTYAREFPKSIESMILTGLFPPEVNLYSKIVTNLNRSINLFFDECESSEECSSKYPDLEKHFYNTISKLKAHPYEVSTRNGNIIINAQDYLLLVHQYLYARGLYSEVPKLILSVKNEDDEAVVDAMKNFTYVFKLINGPMYWSVNAYEELPFNGYEDLEKDLQRFPELSPGPGFFMSDPGMLEDWHDHRASNLENEPVRTSIPTLLLNGEYDPITPPENAVKTMQYLSNSFYKEFKGEGHSILSDCFINIMKEFLQDNTIEPSNRCNEYPAPIDW